jgi:hypothetical protein
MVRRPFPLLAFGLAAGLLGAMAGPDGHPATAAAAPQGVKLPEPKTADFTTSDGVQIKGKFYPCTKAGAACVILLHAYGESSSNKEWTNFAKKLQEKGHAVLTFDFRGHGDSTTVEPGTPNPKNPAAGVKGFWDHKANQQLVKGFVAGKARPTEIKHEQFGPAYLPILANDVCAARAFVEDQPDVNPGNIIIIGAKEGAAIGALWIEGEFVRYRLLDNKTNNPDLKNPEGKVVAAGIFLSLTRELSSYYKNANISAMLDTAAKTHKTPMVFIYGAKDTKAAELAKQCEKDLKGKATKEKEQQFTGALRIDSEEKVVGKNLLVDSLDTTSKIVGLIDDILAVRTPPKMGKKGDSGYVWIVRTGPQGTYYSRQPGSTSWEFLDFRMLMK